MRGHHLPAYPCLLRSPGARSPPSRAPSRPPETELRELRRRSLPDPGAISSTPSCLARRRKKDKKWKKADVEVNFRKEVAWSTTSVKDGPLFSHSASTSKHENGRDYPSKKSKRDKRRRRERQRLSATLTPSNGIFVVEKEQQRRRPRPMPSVSASELRLDALIYQSQR